MPEHTVGELLMQKKAEAKISPPPHNWRVVYVGSNKERVVAEYLSCRLYYSPRTGLPMVKADVETYLPTQMVVRQWSDRKVKRERLVIPRMVFVRCDGEIHLINAIRHSVGVVDFINRVGTNIPAIIPQHEMDNFMLMVNHSPEPVQIDAPTQFHAGDRVRVVSGVMTGLVGTLVSDSDGKSRISISIEMLGNASTLISPELVEKI